MVDMILRFLSLFMFVFLEVIAFGEGVMLSAGS
jgi:hypothetical protein